MTKAEAKERIEKLKELIEKYRYSYHVLDKSIVSDEVNDSLKHELQALENQFPEFITPDSPTQRVGGKPLEKFQKVTHEKPMLSLVDAFSLAELKDWQERNRKIEPESATTQYFAELKIDGLAVSLIYENGEFVRGATRGDGKVGEDVTQNLKTIESIPLKVSSIKKQVSRLEIRGEVYMSTKTFEELNKQYQKENKLLLANPRNAAAGSIRQLDPKIAASRHLSFIAWDLITHTGSVQKNHSDDHRTLSALGFKTIKENRVCKNLDEVENFKNEIEKKRDQLPFGIDGTVVLIDDNSLRERLGVIGKAPRAMIAYKFAPEEATTVVEDIIVQVGRTGTLTPVAVLKPVLVAGSVVSRATLHNEDEIRKKDIRVGDTVVVHKAGDVIPEVASVIKELRKKASPEFRFPGKCPVCGSNVVRESGKAAYKCTNKNCYVVLRKRLEHFVSRASFDMAGLGPKIISKFIDEGLIKDAADLFKLTEGDIEHLERFAEKSAKNIVASIKTHKQIELPRFIYALGIANVGEQTAYDISEIVNQKSKLKSRNEKLKILKVSKLEDWQEIPDIGPVVARSIYDYFHDEKNIEFIDRLFLAGVTIANSQPLTDHGLPRRQAGKLQNKLIVFTGGLESMSRDEAKEIVRNHGGKTSESVSKKTNYVVVGSDAGEKLDQAQKLGIKILSEEEFLQLVNN